ncbi:MAG TPA: helix-turn-helix transcriptional regulator [Xanthomonadales bacterium]|nr:helix-turn-helix transcriptional regulator [Xanthomonadales bacterium]
MKDLTCNGEFQLARFSSVQSKNIDETQAQLSRLIRQHDMLSHGEVQAPTELHYAPLLRMAVSCVRLGTAMKVAAQPVNDSFLIFTAMDNPFEMVIGKQHINVTYEKVAIVTPGMPFALVGSEFSSSVVLDIEKCYLESLISKEEHINLATPLEFNRNGDTDNRSDVTISHLMLYLRNELSRSSQHLHHVGYLEHLEELIAASLIYSNNHNYSEILLSPSEVSTPRHVRIAMDYIHAHAEDALTLHSLAEVAASSSRSLARGFQKYKNCTPMAYLRTVRIERAHEELMRACPENYSVILIANKWGFFNPGRFAQAYRKRFGENPSDTLRRRYVAH